MSYPGSKGQAGTFQRIIGQMPPHSIYVEAFAGSAQVFLRKRPAARSILIDVDAGVASNLKLATSIAAQRSAEVLASDAIHTLPTLALPADAVIYCDPPYMLSTRQGRFYYDHEMSDDHHRQLLAMVQGLHCRVLISGYPSELYGAALREWRCISYRTRTRGKTVTECLWCNFPEPTELHDWRYAGKNFRQRLSLKRMAARWLRRLEAMPAIKRGYLLNAMRCMPNSRV